MEIEDRIERQIKSFTWWKGFKWIVILGVVTLVITLVSGFFSTVATVATAPGRVLQETMSTNNIIESYEWFYDVNASYRAKRGQISQFKGFYAGETDSKEKSRLRIEMAAIQQVCRNLTEKYNANSEKMNKSIFKGWSLPDSLQQSTCE